MKNLKSLRVIVALAMGAVLSPAAEKPHAVIVVGTHHYTPQKTMPLFAAELERLGFETTVINPAWEAEKDSRGLPGLETLEDADVGIFFTRFMKLEDEQLGHIRSYLESGKPVVGFRTSTHAFNYPEGHPQFEWNTSFGRDALGTPYRIHLAGGTTVEPVASAKKHPILTGVTDANWKSPGTLYLTDLQSGVVPILQGTGSPKGKKAAVRTNAFGTHELKPEMTDTIAWTWSNKWGGRTFTTSLGHAGDFAVPNSMRVMVNGVFWAAGQPVPDAAMEIQTFKPGAAPKKKEAEAKEALPNIIVIYTDDQGYGDVSALNPEAKFQTPNFDRLANEGIAFTNGHSSDSVCTPSRYGLLTGRYCWRTLLKDGVFGAERKGLITDDRMTLASLAKEQGYHTAMVGKWHLGMDFPGTPATRDWSQPVRDMPLDKGFDYFYGIPASLNYGILAWFEGRHAAVPPTLLTGKKKNPRHSDYRIMPPYLDPEDEGAKGFEVAPDFIDNQCLTRFTDKALEWMSGKVTEAKEGKPFFLYLPYTSPHYPVCPLPEFHGKGEAGPYGEFLIETDYHVGRILDFLEESGVDENTLILFTSDNGPERIWPERIRDFGHDSRGGYRAGKRSYYEGGHRVPFLVRWPAGIAGPGRSYDGLVGQLDFLATLAELMGVQLPDDAGEDSQSFARVLLDPDAERTRVPLINHGCADARYAITDGPWKLILPGEKTSMELYNLAQDPDESDNLVEAHPERVRELTDKITQIIVNGRSTPGSPQPNDTGYWEDLTWLTEAEYKELLPK
ncbi:sulfatase-like hydrolase/transferase [Roseibacillus persicicus]|uniref:sulfatase-like hydrolase/transferase n=1 Tax=Roseibacillus persicicus TaxID=454148 RepID=UPI00398AFDDB